MAVPNPLEALADLACPHTRKRVSCLRCAADAVRPGVDELSALVRVLEQGRNMLRAHLTEILDAAAPVEDAPEGELPDRYTVPGGPLHRARGTLGEPPPASGLTEYAIIRTDEDWETVAVAAERRAAYAENAQQAAADRALAYAQQILDANRAAQLAEERNSDLEAAVRAEIAAWINDNIVACPEGHVTDPGPYCVWCWRNTALRQAAGAAEGRYGPTQGRVQTALDETLPGGTE